MNSPKRMKRRFRNSQLSERDSNMVHQKYQPPNSIIRSFNPSLDKIHFAS